MEGLGVGKGLGLITDKVLVAGFERGERHKYPCPVCGLFWRWTEPLADIRTSFDICPQCGIEFGYQDCVRSHDDLRAEWERMGKPWHSNAVNPEQYQRVLRALKA